MKIKVTNERTRRTVKHSAKKGKVTTAAARKAARRVAAKKK
jgi:hypothetical protein